MTSKRSKKSGRQKNSSSRPQGSIFRTTLIIITCAIILYIAITTILDSEGAQDGGWGVSDEGILRYPLDRGPVQYTKTTLETGTNYTLEKVTYTSKNTTIYGLLRTPLSDTSVPGVVLLPGAGVTKEDEQGRAEALLEMGYATLAIDQRGIGETDGYVPGMQQDYQTFASGQEPVQHELVYDALRAFDLLKEDPRVDASRIAMFGESMGGRYAIIATAIDPSIKGVMGISTGGFTPTIYRDPSIMRFLRSIDPDGYVSMISPRKTVMIHMKEDAIIPLSLAESTYKNAEQPKELHVLNGTGHGYNSQMKPYIWAELQEIFKSTN